MAEIVKKIALRYRKVAYLNTGTTSAPVWTRMKYFTDITKSKESEEYSRKYVDDEFETTDGISMSENIGFAFDLYGNDPVHKKIADVFDKELLGDDANVEIMQVDYTSLLTEGEKPTEFPAIKRTYAVIPDSEGDGTEAYTYSGSFKVKTAPKFTKVKATDENEPNKSYTVTESTPIV